MLSDYYFLYNGHGDLRARSQIKPTMDKKQETILVLSN